MLKFWRSRKERKIQMALGLRPLCKKCNDTGKYLPEGLPFYEPCPYCRFNESVFAKIF